MEHSFTSKIKEILSLLYGENNGKEIYDKSILIQYINEKTKSADKGSKSRSSFANLYAIYVLIEDYLCHNFDTNHEYKNYQGAQFVQLLERQRELPFGSKLQNHALNNRVNSEFEKFFPTADIIPILRDIETSRYWINENLLIISIGEQEFNIAKAVINIIDEYIKIKQASFQRFIRQCEELQQIKNRSTDQIQNFIIGLLAPNVDARLFEIVSFSILKYYYKGQNIIWGYSWDKLNEETLKLYKTGRTNANDGGIDFVMRPLGRFFQVTETLDFKKYFLDIEKIEKYPLTFVIKSTENIKTLTNILRQDAIKTYGIEDIVNKYMACIEEIINIPILISYFKSIVTEETISDILNEIIIQSKVEFNYEEE